MYKKIRNFIDKYVTPFASVIGVFTFLIGSLAFLLTAVLGFLNKKTIAKNDVENVFSYIISNEFAYFLFDNRYWIVSSLLAVLILYLLKVINIHRSRSISINNSLSATVKNHLKFKEEFLKQLIETKPKKDTDKHYMAALIADELDTLLRNISSIFYSYTRDRCHSSVKLISNDNKISTFGREKDVDRGVGGTEHDWKENTALEMVIKSHKKRSYVNNSLLLSSYIGRYKNPREDWSNDYRATIVIPLTEAKLPSGINEKTVVGFLCVDNMKGGFDSHLCETILFCFAALCLDLCELSEAVEEKFGNI